MDWFPLWNSLRIAVLATAITFFLGIVAAYYVAKLPRLVKGVLDCVLTLPLVLPPTVVGFFLLKLMGGRSALGTFFLDTFQLRMTMVWWAGISAVVVVTFPLMYRTVRACFESFNQDLLGAARTLGHRNSWVFWRVLMPGCKQSLLAGLVLSFARGLGEYGATSMVCGYTPGRTATISTTVYQLWREGNDALAYRWVGLNVLICLVVLVAMNLLEQKQKGGRKC